VAQDPENQIPVHFSSFHGPMIAETLLGMILFFNNSILSFQVNQRLAEWNPNTDYPRTLLRNQHVVILGYGHIGRYCAKLLGSLGPSITGIKRNISGIFDSETGVRYARLENAAMDFAKADHLVVLLPSGEDTNGLVNSNVLNQLKPGCTIYNFGRGTAVNESDLITALDSGHLSAAGLDVFAKEPLPLDSPLWSHPKVLVFPHSSCCYQEYGNLFTLELKEKLRSLLIHQKIINPFG
jgi:phosphoglycerate dehydrogenase-like enzyme